MARFVEPNASLIAFNDNKIILTDLSPGYNIPPTLYKHHEHKIIDIQVFDGYFVSLDANGNCSLWSLKETAIDRRRLSSSSSMPDISNGGRRLGVRQSRAESFNTYTHIVHSAQTLSAKNKDIFKCMHLIRSKSGGLLKLFFGTENGQIYIYDWVEGANKFDDLFFAICDIREQIVSLITITPYFIMILTQLGNIYFINLKSTSVMNSDVPMPRFQYLTPIALHKIDAPQMSQNVHHVAIVFKLNVYKVTFTIKPNDRIGSFTRTDLYVTTATEENHIICSILSEDLKYLILGTKKGISVVDLHLEIEILRGSVSDNISCIDICSLDSEKYKYLLMCGTGREDKFLYMYGLEIDTDGVLMQWAPDRMGSPINYEGVLGKNQLNTWLVGGELFEMLENDESPNVTLFAIDSKGIIHLKNSSDSFVESFKKIHWNIKGASKITTLSVTPDKIIFIGCDNGAVYRQNELFMQFDSAITYLKCYTSNLMVAGTADDYGIMMDKDFRIPSCPIAHTFFISNEYLLIVKANAAFDVIFFLLFIKNFI